MTDRIAYSVGMGCEVMLADAGNGEVWLYRRHGDHWCSVRPATEQDVASFDALATGLARIPFGPCPDEVGRVG